MKKFLVLAMVATVASSSLFADAGWKVGIPYKMETWQNSVNYFMKDESHSTCMYKFQASQGYNAESKKLVSAMVMTAIASNQKIEIYMNDVECTDNEAAKPHYVDGIKLVK